MEDIKYKKNKEVQRDTNLKTQPFSEEIKKSFIDYAMSVITSRALPDVRDGLKPVQRRIVYALNSLGMYHNKPYKKSARVIGEVIGKYHPHGDSSIYSAMVRLAQDFNTNYLLVDGHGNFGSIDGDPAAAMRYTEVRMSKISQFLISDINKNTVNFKKNYDGSEVEPEVLPSYLPNLLINGSVGIAVGMATSIPPHNLTETMNAIIAVLKKPEITIEELFEKYIFGPDFPTYGIIEDTKENILNVYKTGKGQVSIKSKIELETKNNKTFLVIKEIPFGINKTKLMEKIHFLIKNKKILYIRNLKDESNWKGIRIVIELTKPEEANWIINRFFKFCSLKINYNVNLLALVDKNQPKLLNLKEILNEFINFQFQILIRKLKFFLKKDEHDYHINLGLVKALENIDEVIRIIKKSSSNKEAKENLIEKYSFSKLQAEVILSSKLSVLTKLETEKIKTLLKTLEEKIKQNKLILSNKDLQTKEIIKILSYIKNFIKSKRKTKIKYISENNYKKFLSWQDFNKKEDIIICFTKKNYIKRINIENLKNQRKGGKGSSFLNNNFEDQIKKLIFSNTFEQLILCSSLGKIYKIENHKINDSSNKKYKGIPIVNLLNLEKNEVIVSIFNFDFNKEYKDYSLFFLTKNGNLIKKSIDIIFSLKKSGKKAFKLKDNDTLSEALLVKKNKNICLVTKFGKVMNINESSIYLKKSSIVGVKTFKLDKNDFVLTMASNNKGDSLFSISTKGYAKLTHISKYRVTNRTVKGKNIMQLGKRDHLSGIALISGENEEIIIFTKNNKAIRIFSEEIKKTNSSHTKGSKIIKLDPNDKVESLVVVRQYIKLI